MKARACGEDVVQLTRLGAVNCYLVREDDEFTLVDTGIRGSSAAIVAAARAAGGMIVRIALTHAHADHVGSLAALRSELPDVEVGIGSREARLLAGDGSLDASEPQAKVRGTFGPAQLEPTRLLEPGDRVGSLEVIASPGHTPGHVAFLDVRDRTLLAGDAFQTLGGIAVAGVIRPLFPFPGLATWHRPTAVESAKALVALLPARLAVGHGRVLEAPGRAMEDAVAAASSRVSR